MPAGANHFATGQFVSWMFVSALEWKLVPSKWELSLWDSVADDASVGGDVFSCILGPSSASDS
jgi:hypothetical protein